LRWSIVTLGSILNRAGSVRGLLSIALAIVDSRASSIFGRAGVRAGFVRESLGDGLGVTWLKGSGNVIISVASSIFGRTGVRASFVRESLGGGLGVTWLKRSGNVIVSVASRLADLVES
jgi:hypothetical protein